MTTKHFVRLAAELRAVVIEANRSGCIGRIRTANDAVIAVANSCAAINDRFDRDRFYRACGV